MATVKSFRDLDTWKQAFQAAQEIFRLSKSFPQQERFSLTDQIRRSSRAVTAMIAEAWGRRRYRAVFANKLDEAIGEANETQSWLAHALRCEYLTASDYRSLDAEYQLIGGRLNRMIDRADDFCKFAPSTDYRAVRKTPPQTPDARTDERRSD